MNIKVFNQKDELFETYNNVYVIDFDDSNEFGIYDNDSHKLLVNLPFEKFYYVETDNKKEQKLNNLFDAVATLRDYWLGLDKNTEETLDGFIFSLFSMIDGESGSNDFHHLIIKDKGTVLNNDNYLHELWVRYCEEENIDFNNI